MEHQFCTLFDRNYLTRGLALYRSLESTCPSFRLWVFCMDAESKAAFEFLALPAVTVVSLAELERHDAALLATKHDRSTVEYYWTATPAVCRYVLETQPGVAAVTYLDADVLFFSDPQPLFDELGEDAVLIVPHRYAPEHRFMERPHGIFNVEWLTFRRDADGLAVLHWWHDRCIEWCYDRVEDGKFGDQKYLDEFPRLFAGVRVLENPGGGLAPWNVSASTLTEENGELLINGRPVVFFHYHSLRLYRAGLTTTLATVGGRLHPAVAPLDLAWSMQYPVSDEELRLLWLPYLRALADAQRDIEAAAPGAVRPPPVYPVGELVAGALRLIRRSARSTAGRILVARRDHRGSWRSSDVAQQMLALTEAQLLDPDSVGPYRAFVRLLPELTNDAALPMPARFLDVGCGIGAYAELLDRHVPGRFVYVGVDSSAEIIEKARERAPERDFEARDLFEPGGLDGFDVVFASALVDVLPDPQHALETLLDADARFVVVHRQQIDERPEATSSVSVVGGYVGQRTYRTTLGWPDVERAMLRRNRRLVAAVDVEDGVRSLVFVRDR